MSRNVNPRLATAAAVGSVVAVAALRERVSMYTYAYTYTACVFQTATRISRRLGNPAGGDDTARLITSRFANTANAKFVFDKARRRGALLRMRAAFHVYVHATRADYFVRT